MFPRAPRLLHLVFVAACLVAAAVFITLWQMDRIHDEKVVTDKANHGSIVSDSNTANQQDFEKEKPLQDDLDDELERYSDETSDGRAVSDSQPAANQQDLDKLENSLQQEQDNIDQTSIVSDSQPANEQDVKEDKSLQREDAEDEESTSENQLYRAYDHLTTLLLFVGYSRSRHSLVSSLLDAHPHMIVADESYALRKWVSNPDWKTTKSKYDFFDTMMGNSVRSSKHGRRSRDSKGSAANLQIFGYSIPDQWQGAYDEYIQVIGDKTAWDTAVMLRLKGTDAIYEMEEKLGVKVKFLHVVRNPFDNIATFVLRHRDIQARNADPDIKINASDILDTKIQLYNNWAEGTYVAQKTFPEAFMNVVSMDAVKKPAETLRKICDFLDVTCSEKYIQDCAAIVDPVPSITRHRIVWKDEQINRVNEMMRKFPFYDRFTFEDE
ncbi:uncharacterized protein LOC144628003 isoform X2 [Oculina patagonica]